MLTLANAGLADAAFFGGMIMLALAGLSALMALIGICVSLCRPDSHKGLPVTLSILGLFFVLVYVASFWAANGDGAWDHACRYVEFHAGFAGLPFLANLFCLSMTIFRRRKQSI
ncbi:MAG: hypothetical protein LLG01_14410 [Planctomycetaceae bacterium]|nr:hypothetical protein [Planctomycetaceae bacterium]